MLETKQLIYESRHSLIYHQKLNTYHQSVIIKVLRAEFPSLKQITQFNNEYELTKNLTLAGIRKAYEQTKIDNKFALVLEYFDGQPIKGFFKDTQPDLSLFLYLSIQIADTLGELHQRNIIHKDINGNNILVDRQNQTIKIIDFGVSTKIDLKTHHVGNPDTLEGTLAYISPEQTGRMNRRVDYRTDLYSLGVTFYELLTGQLPFQGENALAIVHSHIARQPQPIFEIKPNIPPVLAKIVAKLMAKNAEDRYQSAFSLKHDLEACLTALQETGKIASFPIDEANYSDKFQIPEKLYGRQKELTTLLNTFNRVASGGKEMMLVAGYSGVGKSALVNEIHKPITQKAGFFISGKYDQFQRNIPYSAINVSFNEFCDYLITLKEEDLKIWQAKIQTAMGEYGKLLTDVIPNLKLIIGPQPEVTEVSPQETQTRFNTVMQNFVKVIATANHPLVMFIDDLQWADIPSLNLLKALMLNTDNRYFLLIGAYRNNEVGPSHPLLLTIAELTGANVAIQTVHLENLLNTDVSHLIADALGYETPEDTLALTDLVYTKTLGNAFFTHQILKAIYEEGLLYFDISTKKWAWDLTKIAGKNITANVVELMSQKITKLSVAAQEALKLATCSGNQFDLETLAVIDQKSLNKVLALLWETMLAGLILPLDDNYKLYQITTYSSNDGTVATEKTNVSSMSSVEPSIPERPKAFFKFIHDRVQQAAYSLIEEDKKQAIHLRIGELLLANTTPAKLDERIFDIVNQLNQGRNLITAEPDLINLAELNVKAGFKAKATAAYQPALKYFTLATELLDDDKWKTHYNLIWTAYQEKGGNEYSCALLDESAQTLQYTLTKSNTEDHKVKIYQIYLGVLFQQNKHHLGVKIGREGLQMLGVNLPRKVGKHHIIAQVLKFRLNLGRRKIPDLIDLPQLTDNHLHNICAIIYDLVPSAYQIDPDLMAYISLIMANLCIRHGNFMYAPFAYGMASVVFSGALKLFNTGYQLAILALKLNEKIPELNVKARVHFLAANFSLFWSESVTKHEPLIQIALHSARNSGSLNWADYSLVFSRTQHILFNPKSLAEIEAENIDYYHLHLEQKDQEVIINHYFLLNLIHKWRNLAGEPARNPFEFDEERYKIMVPNLPNFTMRTYFYTFKMVDNYLDEDYKAAFENALASAAIVDRILGALLDFVQRFYFLLTVLAYPHPLTRQQHLKVFIPYHTNKFLLNYYAKSCPENFLAHLYLFQAEEARVNNQNKKAQDYYKKAIKEAEKLRFPQNTALCYELYGKYWLTKKEAEIAGLYLKKALHAYQLWGAIHKAKNLEQKYYHLLPVESFSLNPMHTTQGTFSVTTSSHSTTGAGAILDTATLVKASQAISSEIDLEKLLTKLLKIVIENAGATHGSLLLMQKSELLLEAQGTAEKDEVMVLQAEPLSALASNTLPLEIIQYVARTQENLVLKNASQEGKFTQITYITNQKPKSILCTPLLNQGALLGIIYLENKVTTNTFTTKRVEIVNLLGTQAIISITNAQAIIDQAEQERLHLEQEHLRLQNDLLEKQSQELAKLNADKDKFFSIVSHDLRGPFTALLGGTQLLNQSLERLPPDTLKNMSNNIHNSAKAIYNLLENLLTWSRIQRGLMPYQPEAINLSQLVDGTMNLLQESAMRKEITLNNTIHPGFIVYADRNMLDTVIRNLTSNALKFTPNSGQVLICAKLKNVTQTPNISHLVEIWVADSGVGISQADIAKLFRIDTHHTTEGTAQEQGTGLGLIMCQEMVIKNQGQIWVESKLNRGTTVKFNIPLHQTADADMLQTIVSPKLPDFTQTEEEIKTPSSVPSFEDLIVPPQEMLSILLDLAKRGNLRALRKAANNLKDMDAKYIPFANKLHLLAINFEDREIMSLLETYRQK